MSSSYEIFSTIQRQRVSDGQIVPILSDCADYKRLLILVWPQLGDFDSLEYAWWLEKEAALWQNAGITIRAIGIGDRNSGLKFSEYTKFRQDWLFVDPKAELHNLLGLYRGLSLKLPGFSPGQNAWLNLIFMCAGVGSPGTLAEVLRGYLGDRKAPQLIAEEETIQARPLPAFRGSLFNLAGGQGFQRPFELATLRLRNMSQVLGNWSTYIPDSSYLTQRGGTFLFDSQGNLLYEHRDQGILGFAENMSYPLAFLQD
ncbi:peroxiredoxin-like family protein [Microcystis aeruginosa CS-558/01A06]|uniref:AhpC/TSA family protein n=1 Tax=Microcystis aeruginosa BLCC-F108 TaxID=2755317 RepID=A0A841UWF3_MICAE|nr:MULTISPECIES: peroxiredoxin-like family protein [Microcystis]MBC1193030.1 AhpC/TSA family protein [Microcystis aeruginosa BLCC-F108]MCA2589476.1 AhpC/TSA family protein [Microcystis sp. M31BS1]MDB9407056.1 peroxiredoxin-like family protein [Microcystis aeruginosa CS-558/01A06]